MTTEVIENDILGFDPSQLTVNNRTNNERPQSQGNPFIYKTKPQDSKSEDGHYRCVIKPVYNPFNFKDSILEQQSYAIHDEKGWLTVISSLTVGDTSCPIFKAWKKCHYAKKEENPELWKQAALKKDGGNEIFDKRFARYCVVQVLEDENQPELVGKYLFWKLPKAIYELIMNKQSPSPESKKAAIPVMDYLFGRSIELEVVPGPGNPGDERYARDTKYIGELSEDPVSVINPDGSPILNDREQAVLDDYVALCSKIWKSKDPETRESLSAELNANPLTAELRTIYSKVLAGIKTVCPNLIEQLSYKEWNDETKARVQKWIDIVLSGNDPAKSDEVPEVISNNSTDTGDNKADSDYTVPAAEPTTAPFTQPLDNNDDLPF